MALLLLCRDVLTATAKVQVGNAPLPNVTQVLGGLVTLVDPIAFADTSAKIRASGVASVIAATGALGCPSHTWAMASMNDTRSEPCRSLLSFVGLRCGAHSDALPSACVCAGIDYNPCVVASGPLGALAVAEAIGIQPQLITVGPSGAVLVAVGVLSIHPSSPPKLP